MRSNPFYALSACAMLMGCWLLSRALHLQAGQLGGLLLLVGVLQVYEGLLVGLGAFLVRTGRAPRDGATVLALESVFLVDATLLAAEVVTADARVGTGVAVVLAALAAVKLAWVRQSAPALLSRRAAVLLGAHAAFVLALPAVSAHLAGARIFGPLSLLALWWTTLALPFARRALRDATLPDGQDAASPWHAAWTWGPAAMALLHLWAVGYIHSIDFQPAFLAPFLLGLAVTSRADQLAGQVVASAGAVLVSVGQEEALRWHLLGADALLVSPFRLALLGVAVAWCYLAWRDRARWLAVLGAGCAVAGLVGPAVSSGSSLLGRVLRWLGSALPSDAFEWGATTVVAAFVLLVAGARRSLAGAPGRPRPAVARVGAAERRFRVGCDDRRRGVRAARRRGAAEPGRRPGPAARPATGEHPRGRAPRAGVGGALALARDPRGGDDRLRPRELERCRGAALPGGRRPGVRGRPRGDAAFRLPGRRPGRAPAGRSGRGGQRLRRNAGRVLSLAGAASLGAFAQGTPGRGPGSLAGTQGSRAGSNAS